MTHSGNHNIKPYCVPIMAEEHMREKQTQFLRDNRKIYGVWHCLYGEFEGLDSNATLLSSQITVSACICSPDLHSAPYAFHLTKQLIPENTLGLGPYVSNHA